MTFQADLALYDHNGRLTALVEVKNKRSTSTEWASQFRRNLLAQGEGSADFFLIVTPDRLYLWKGGLGGSALVPPTCQVDTRTVLRPYFESTHVDPRGMSGHAFELIVSAWLSDLVHSREEISLSQAEGRCLMESGLLPAIRDGRIVFDAAA